MSKVKERVDRWVIWSNWLRLARGFEHYIYLESKVLILSVSFDRMQKYEASIQDLFNFKLQN